MGRPELRGTAAAPIFTVPAGIWPVLAKRYQQGKFIFHAFDIRRATEGAPRKAVGIHTVVGAARALAFGVDGVGDHVGKRHIPLRHPGDHRRVATVTHRGGDLLPFFAREAGTRDAVGDGAHGARADHHRIAGGRPWGRRQTARFGKNKVDRRKGCAGNR